VLYKNYEFQHITEDYIVTFSMMLYTKYMQGEITK